MDTITIILAAVLTISAPALFVVYYLEKRARMRVENSYWIMMTLFAEAMKAGNIKSFTFDPKSRSGVYGVRLSYYKDGQAHVSLLEIPMEEQ